ncbi:polyprenyl synthetase family protein [Varibaculum cambriense]|uniref:polyprenyl synthetase family protein n=1 Tax=Varibaculum cambriense TaxID=184870 RepID=UPI002554819A|nr:polyprenyl synthetase family protein [Varibaculum cambriense]MDK8274960.1 polyprenyl synthetase family protein [Varibaculum cambriense]
MSNLSQQRIDELEDQISDGLVQVEDRLTQVLADDRGVLDDIVGHLAKAGGKRMRPGLVLLCSHLGPRPSSEEVLRACLVVELTHLATLYHDDVMDSAPTRRGVNAVQRVWGNNRAVLAGDLVFARASQVVATLGPEAVLQHAVTFDRLCRGQLNETFGPEAGQDPVEFYIQVLADKTGSLVAQSARFGAELSGAPDAVAKAVVQFGEKIGVAFQLADDVIDLSSDSADSGKTPGTDLREGVDTMPILLLRQDAARGVLDEDGQKILAELSRGALVSEDAALERVVQMLRAHSVLERTRQLAFSWCEDAKAAIAFLEDTEVKAALEKFADTLVDRIA